MTRLWCILCFLVITSLPIFSQTQEVYKRRIGMRLPNMLHYRPTTIEKRRIGMRLPNIIYLRNEPEKKDNWDVAELEEEIFDGMETNGRISQNRTTKRLRREIYRLLGLGHSEFIDIAGGALHMGSYSIIWKLPHLGLKVTLYSEPKKDGNQKSEIFTLHDPATSAIKKFYQ